MAIFSKSSTWYKFWRAPIAPLVLPNTESILGLLLTLSAIYLAATWRAHPGEWFIPALIMLGLIGFEHLRIKRECEIRYGRWPISLALGLILIMGLSSNYFFGSPTLWDLTLMLVGLFWLYHWIDIRLALLSHLMGWSLLSLSLWLFDKHDLLTLPNTHIAVLGIAGVTVFLMQFARTYSAYNAEQHSMMTARILSPGIQTQLTTLLSTTESLHRQTDDASELLHALSSAIHRAQDLVARQVQRERVVRDRWQLAMGKLFASQLLEQALKERIQRTHQVTVQIDDDFLVPLPKSAFITALQIILDQILQSTSPATFLKVRTYLNQGHAYIEFSYAHLVRWSRDSSSDALLTSWKHLHYADYIVRLINGRINVTEHMLLMQWPSS